MPLKLPHPLEYLFKGHKGSLQSWIYGLNHSMGNRTEFSRMKGRSSGYSEGLLYSWDGIGWQQASRKSHIQGEKRPGRGHQGRLNSCEDQGLAHGLLGRSRAGSLRGD